MKNKKLLLIITILLIAIMFLAGCDKKTQNTEADSIENEIKKVYSDSIVSFSEDKEILCIELHNLENGGKIKNEIIETIKRQIENNKLKNCKILIIYGFLNSNEKTNQLFVKELYSIPDFEHISTKKYINYEVYDDLYNLTINEE